MDPVIPVVELAPKPKTNVLMWVIGEIVILGVGVGIGLFLAKNIFPPLQILPAPTPSLIAIVDPTANWKTYTNTTYGYSISYPASYVLTNIVDGGGSVVTPNAESISISESSGLKYEDRLIDLSHLGLLVDISPADQWQKTSVTIARVKSTKFTKIDKSANFDYYHIPTKGTEGIELMINNKQQVKVDQILSTFRFVDQATPKPTCKPRPACLDATPRCLLPETSDMCPPNQKL